MKIRVLGTRGEIEISAPHHAWHSGIFLNKKIMFDLGEKEFLKYHPKYIFITHLHPDHAFFVRKLADKTEIDIPIYGAEKFPGIKIKSFTKTKKIDGYSITPIPTIHSIKVKSQAYLIKKGNEKILYTGDMIWIEKKYHRKLKNLTLVITEASHIRKKGLIRREQATGKIFGHTGVPDLIKLFSKFTNTILFMHFGSWFYENSRKSKKEIQELAKSYKMKALIAYDGMTVDTKNLNKK